MSARYRKVKKLGSGGFGEVWLAERVSDRRCLAVKYLLDEDQDSVERFRREVRCLSKLDHPNIMQIVSHQLLTPPYCYAMQSYKGSLYDEFPGIIQDSERIYTVFRSILDAVRYAHSEGVIHRDLKPENVLMNSDSDLVVSDFGLGRILDSNSTRRTVSGIRLGTFMYCAPEQMRDFRSADTRSDVFSLGRMLYEMYTGELSSAVQELAGVPALIAPVIERATKADPNARYQSVEDMLGEFDNAMKVLVGIVEADSLDTLLEKLRAKDSWTEEDLSKLIAAIRDIRTEDELAHTALMNLPAGLLVRLAERSRGLALALVEGFSRHAKSQGWPFSYTDAIAEVALSLFEALGDPEMRACLVEAALVVGVDHNRWHVMEVAGRMIESADDPNLIGALLKTLREHGRELSYIERYISRAKLHPALRSLFPENS